jgi:ATP-dependent exoDNAse (exonuclease V) beta subunit
VSADFTAEQRAAIDDRTGSRLLSASAGSGKTRVMVERFVEAVAADGVPVASILAITFTEKAAGELKQRIRARLVELGRTEDARAADGAWIGTIHGFCARVLRAHPLAAGLDPRFRVFEEPTATRLAATAFARAYETWTAEAGAPAVDLAAAYGYEPLRTMILGVYGAQRSAGQTAPRLPEAHAADPEPARAALAATAARALAELAGASGANVAKGIAALERCTALLAQGSARAAGSAAAVPTPGALGKELDLGSGANALKSPACDAYREALTAYRDACAAHHAAPAVRLLDALLQAHHAAYVAVKRERAGVDFGDLELGVRDLFDGDAALAARWRERFALVMVDEFQDTNRVQLGLLSALERDNLFAVGDEFQAIYGFRHADVDIFRERRAALGVAGNHRLTANFRSRPEILDAVNTAFRPLLGPSFEPLVAGGREHELRLFDPGSPSPAVELLTTETPDWGEHEAELGLALPQTTPERRAEARLVAGRLAEEVAAGRKPGEIVLLVRSTGSLGLFEQALEEAGLPTYVVGGRGYWAQEQVRDGLAYLRALANPHDEEALFTVLASPFCGVGADTLIELAAAGRESGEGAWAALRGQKGQTLLSTFAAFFAAEREAAARVPVEGLLERAVTHTGYDLAVLARAGGERRLANLRKLMRLAREYEATEGRDLRGFLAHAAAQDFAQAREGEAALETDDLNAVRLMTIHRAKGLEFPVVCVADLGKSGQGQHPGLLVDGDRVGLRLRTLGGGDTSPALDYKALCRDKEEAEAAEERRLLYVALTRAEDRLIVSGTADPAKPAKARFGGPPFAWLLPALLPAPGIAVRRHRAGDPLPAPPAEPDASAADDTPEFVPPLLPPVVPRAPTRRLSYSSLSDYARCGYRFYLQRVLNLPSIVPAWVPDAAAEGPVLDPRVRGTLAHRALEDLDFARPQAPAAADIEALAADEGANPTPEEIADVQSLVAAFAASPLCGRLAAAAEVRREAAFAFALDAPSIGPLVTGFLDVIAVEADGTVLIVDYKTDRLGESDPEEAVERGYAIQRAVYALAALRNGARRVDVAYCFLERPEVPVAATFTEPEALETVLTANAAGILGEDWSVTPDPHRELCADCPGQPALCSYPEELTLRPRDYSSSFASLTGSGGPS